MAQHSRKYKVIISEETAKFLRGINSKAAKKITTVIDYVAGGDMNTEFFKKLSGTDIWEIRAQFMGIAYRLLAFWDTRHKALIVTTHGFVKKTQKTPEKEIERANAIRKEYFQQHPTELK